jgi:hypothetical protein
VNGRSEVSGSRPSRLDDTRRLARAALDEAKADDDTANHSFHLGSLEAALKGLLDALDAQEADR